MESFVCGDAGIKAQLCVLSHGLYSSGALTISRGHEDEVGCSVRGLGQADAWVVPMRTWPPQFIFLSSHYCIT